MLPVLLAVHRADRYTVGFGSLVQLLNVGTSLYLSSAGPSDPGRGPEYFGAFGPCGEGGYWAVGRVDVPPKSSNTSVRCGSVLRLVSAARGANLALAGALAAFRFVDGAGDLDGRALWSVACDPAGFWTRGAYVQFRNYADECLLAARLDRRTHPHAQDRYPLECVPGSTANTLWVVDAGVFAQQDLDDGMVLLL
jgi:hypothetical protein